MPCKSAWRTRIRGTPRQVGKKFKLTARTSLSKLPRLYIPPKTYYRKGKLIRRKGYYREDIGAKGRGEKVIPELKAGLMTKEAIECGVLTEKEYREGKRIGDLSKAEIKKLAEHLRKKYGQRKAQGMFQAQLVFRKRMADGFKEKMEYGRKIAVGKIGVLD